ncbi:hypothetical protein O1W68_10440 [Rhodococcus sp. H36-A4]|uniref:hypothetical protein n=1 Tax=Rhodococcus sp. H36-A4 TaxID=3004353 RepID=UPI0022AF97DB|nr:hypothetical protein [Rhodococcus sp. H36-A4]MCZ4078361.1 hypothetical protein [Rhodococcus sp. H36-A4]
MTEENTDTDRSTRHWKIPSRLFGRARTSTVALGICFVLTALLYGQVRPEPESAVNGPTPIDTGQYQNRLPSYVPESLTPPTGVPPSSSVDSTTSQDPSDTSGTPGEPGQQQEPGQQGGPGSSTGESGSATTQVPTYLPGITVPPQLRSLYPQAPAPSAPSSTP